MIHTTEQDSRHQHLEQMSTLELLIKINQEDQTVPLAISKILPSIEALVEIIVKKMQHGGRLFYIGAGTSGRLGIVDASECPPTFGVPHEWVVGIIAGGDSAIRKAVEFAEDDSQQAWKDLLIHDINIKDVLIGIAASGGTPYVLGGLQKANEQGVTTGCIVCNQGSSIAKEAKYPIEAIVGPEFVTGSTRMKSGTAQKLILNMISTSVMIKLGRIKGNKMVDMQLSNNKLVDRAIRMLMAEMDIPKAQAQQEVQKYGSVRKALEALKNKYKGGKA